jgi:sugar phosphate isomerase/epimerase
MPDLACRLSLSSCWNSHRHSDGYEMLAEIRSLGFARAELSHGVRLDLAPGILRAVDEGIIAISSVHNFCPLPATIGHAAPNLFQPSARKKNERGLWLLHTQRTLEFAARVRARDVVMHSGSTSFLFRDPSVILEAEPPPESAVREKALSRLRRGAAGAVRRVLAAYDEILPSVVANDLVLGVENREGILELPLDDGFDDFFAHFADEAPVGYWHDTGHARIKHLGGFLDHESHLAARAARLVGFHLHDVDEQGRDHRAPGTGSVDFDMIARYVRRHHTLVFEPHPSLTTEEILRSREFLLEKLGG